MISLAGLRLFLLVILNSVLASATSASFYGASFIALPLQEAKKSTEISFRLKTYRPDAILLLAAGETDYCLIILEGGALRVRINLGAGESELSSPPRLRLNDLLWHDVTLKRETAQVTLNVDGIHVTRQVLPGRFHELNIHHGLFLGGRGDFTDLFLGLLENYRGCLDQVVYNGLDIIQEVKKSPETVEMYAVDWDCAEEFDAKSNVPISFVNPDAYIAFDQPFGRTGGSIDFELKTQAENSLLLYNSGPPSKSDFVALEIVDKHLRLIIDKGNGPIDLNSTLLATDGQWHKIEAHFSPSHLEVGVDDKMISKSTFETESKFLDLSGFLFIGGVEVNKKSRAVHQGSINGGKSLTGCIRNLRVNEKSLGIRDPRVTHGIKTRCLWAYPCLKSPCIEGATCLQEGTDGFKCQCDLPLCIRQDFTTGYSVFTRTTLPSNMELISVSPLEVLEGGKNPITQQQLQITLDYEKFGVRESGVIFHVHSPPKSGKLQVEFWGRSGESAFTLLDISQKRVTYLHDGSETLEDSMILELELITQAGYILPSFLQVKHRFVLPVTVTPLNDPPSINLPPGQVLRLPLGTKVTLSKKIFNATDPDTSPGHLKYTILNLKDGLMQSLENPGAPIKSFTQEDINLALISYIHKGDKDSQIIFRVSDGFNSTPNVILRVAAFELKAFLINNTGLNLAHRTFSLITSANLSFSSNAINNDIQISYLITDPPRYGSVQRLENVIRWQTVNHFSALEVERGKIRYEHTTKNPQFDEFQFRVIVGEKEFQKQYPFRISFVSLSVEVIKNADLLIDRITESFISESFLRSTTKPSTSPPEYIKYTLISTPHYGSIFLSSGDLTRHTRLKPNFNFTQEDIAKGRIKYKLHHKTYSQFHDAFEFIVSSKGQRSDIHIFNIRYKPPHLDAIVRIDDLDVTEGSMEAITEKNLKIHKDGLQFLVYNVTTPPRHGSLIILEKGMPMTKRKNVQQFTSADVQLGVLFYLHDDSETLEDNFYFVAFGKDPSIDFQYVGVLNFNILLKNDNPPKRTMEKVFNVVTNAQRMVTSNDLSYYDPDLDTPPDKIRFTARAIQNGEFFNISKKARPIFSFTQEDIDKGSIFFRHRGAIYSEAYITVSDGSLSTPGTLEIVASDPFVEIYLNSGILVPRGGSAYITKSNLSVETNLNAWGKNIGYRLLKGPNNGKLKVHGKVGALQFTEYDLQNNDVEYHHDGDPKIKDEFKFRVNIGEMYTEGIFEIRIFPESYWEPLSIVANSTVKVEEHSEITIDENSLLIMHPSIPPSDITYMVVQKPQYGNLQIDKKLLPQRLRGVVGDQYYDYDYEEEIDYTEYAFKNEDLRFTQAMVNEGRIRYEHTSKNLTMDYMIFDVTNGITSMHGLYLILQVIPKTVYVTAGSIEVDEGSKSILSPSLITILSPYYRDRLDSLVLSQTPRHGLLQRSTNPGHKLVAFSPVELEKGLIEYVHDGSEVERDAFSLVAISDRRESSPVRVSIAVKRVNDQPPQVVRNEELQLWEGETVPITSQILAVYDEDTLPQFIRYKVSSPECGFLSIMPNLSQIATNFTQEDIDDNRLYFTHTGPLTGKIRWRASDGQHNTGIYFTSILAKSLHLKIIRNDPLYVFPMLQKRITLDHLLVTTNAGVSQRSIVFTIKHAPELGSILLKDSRGLMRAATNFTQRNVNESEVFYQHLKPFYKLYSKDFFIFDVKTPFAEPLVNQKFEIHITISGKKGGEIEKYLKLDPLRVIEGGAVSLYKRNVNLNSVTDFLIGYTGAGYNVDLNTRFLNQPKYGYLEMRGRNITGDTSITPFDFEQGAISYHHDGSDTLYDQIPINVYLIESTLSTSDILLYNGSLNVSIIPVNDQPFILMTPKPSMNVVRGQKALIKRINLLTVDADNAPNEIMYDIMTGPDYGRLVLSDNFSISLHSFTQEDLDMEKVLYIHDGSNSTARFHFQVSDGEHDPKYDAFTINLLSLELKLVNRTIVKLKQSTTESLITSRELAAVTNGDTALIYNNITRFPKYGKIYVNEIPVRGFSQMNIDTGKVTYIQEDLGASGDSFALDIRIYDQVIPNVKIQIAVAPLLKSKPVHAIVGGRTRITLEHLNASQLAEVTNSMPFYRLSKSPRLGRLKKSSKRAKRAGRGVQIKEFTHDDIRTGKIFYVARKIRLKPGEIQHDVLNYILTAPSPDVQPAQGSLKITLATTLLEDAAEGRQLRPGIPPEERTPASPSRPHPTITETSYTSDYFLLAAIVGGILLITILVVFIIRCSTNRRVPKGGNGSNIEVVPGNTMDIDVASLPPPICTDSRPNSFMTEDFSELEGPHISPLETSPRPTRLNPHALGNGMTLSAHISDSEVSWPREISREVSPSVPQCKVTPLCPEPSCQSPCQSTYQTPPSLAGYPYGADAEQVEEWSMYETQPLRSNNPMLRKNQYWV